MNDVIDELAGIAPGSRLSMARDGRLEARRAAQQSYELLLHPEMPGEVLLLERRILAAFVVALHEDEVGNGTTGKTVLDHYGKLLEQTDESVFDIVLAEAERGRTRGPYGHFPKGPLSAEDKDGLHYTISISGREKFGDRLSAALEHAHLLVFHPRDARSSDLQRLLDAGWSTPGIVTLSQLVAFLSFQLRVILGLTRAQSAFDKSQKVTHA